MPSPVCKNCLDYAYMDESDDGFNRILIGSALPTKSYGNPSDEFVGKKTCLIIFAQTTLCSHQ